MRLVARRQIGVGAGLALGALALVWLGCPANAQLHAPGPMNTGHADLACEDCHREAPGNTRQQLQNAAHVWLGGDGAPVDVGYRTVDNAACAACHDRPDDRHPSFRFLEPRFALARAELAPERCVACHREHAGARVTVEDPGFCRHCHDPIEVEHDPLDVSHLTLVADRRWDSCLGCHDYHGNHALTPPRVLVEAIAPARILTYFTGDVSPYPPVRRPARTTPEEP